MKTNLKTLGFSLIGFSLILLFILAFVKRDVDNQAAFLCGKFHENQLPMEECPAHQSNTSWMFIAAFAIGFLMLGIGIYLAFMPKQTGQTAESKREFKPVELQKLSEEEKQVYGLIKNKAGSAYQSDLIKETGFSKVKVTRILDRLEAQGILERKRRGMTNIIVLR